MILIDTIKVNNELGEGIIWDHGRQCVWWTDILQSKLYRYDPIEKKLENWDTQERLCCFAPVTNDTKLVCAFESGFAFYQPETGKIDWIAKLEYDNPGTRFNDGRTDRQGRLWAGTMIENGSMTTSKGNLYCLHKDLTTTKTIGGLSIPNSLCWSPDGNTLYHTDTPTQTIKQYTFNTTTAELSDAKTFIKTEAHCYPDGSIIDSNGYLWNAQWGGSKVVRYSPSGKIDLELSLPTSQPTCVAFGGERLDLLFVTSAWSQLSDTEKNIDQNAGNVFVFKTNMTGLEEANFG